VIKAHLAQTPRFSPFPQTREETKEKPKGSSYVSNKLK